MMRRRRRSVFGLGFALATALSWAARGGRGPETAPSPAISAPARPRPRRPGSPRPRARPAPTRRGPAIPGASMSAALSGKKDEKSGKVTVDLATLAADIKLTKTAVNFVWTLICGFLVMFMQAGFALVETGLTRAKNVAHTMAMNFLVYAIGILGFWALGFGLQMGGVGALATFGGDRRPGQRVLGRLSAARTFGLFGMEGFFLTPAVYDAPVAGAVPVPDGVHGHRGDHPHRRAGRALEVRVVRASSASSIARSSIRSTRTGSGAAAGCRDAGHQLRPGPRPRRLRRQLGRAPDRRRDGAGRRHRPRAAHRQVQRATARRNAIPGHNIPMAVLGTFILAFGWFGFNAGSTLAATDTRIAVDRRQHDARLGAPACLGALFYTWARFGKPDLTMMCNGMLAGVVAITAPCAVRQPGRRRSSSARSPASW